MKVAGIGLLGALLCFILCNGCSTPGKSAGEGALIGGGAGLAAGAIAGGGHFRNIVIGTAIGGAVGAGAGYLIGNSIQDQKEAAYAQGKTDAKTQAQENEATPSQQPKLIPAKTEAHWVSDQVHGETFIPGHFEYRILQKAHWEAP
jgi:hypothetical protein